MSTITWLHLSDLHFREGEQHTEGEQHKWDEDIVLRALLDDIRERMKSDGLIPDFIAVTGDIAFSGKPAEYALAAKFFDELRAVTKLDKSRLFLVPGNHDVDRSHVSNLDKRTAAALTDRESLNELLRDAHYRRSIFRRLDGYADFVRRYYAGKLAFGDENYFYVTEVEVARRKVAVLGLNSAWLAYGDQEDRAKLALGDIQVRKSLKQTEKADFRIALAHHPFDWLLDFDSDECQSMLADKCAFVLHGHLHHSVVSQVVTPDGSTVVLVGGACYESAKWPNACNWVRLDLEAGKGVVLLRRYSPNRGGFWAEDHETYRNVRGKYTFNWPLVRSSEPKAQTPDVPRKSAAAQRRDYLNALIGDCNRLRLSGLDPTAADPTLARPMRLEQVYVELDTRTPAPGRERDRPRADAGESFDRQRPLSALQAISQAPGGRVVLLGQPGSGKSTFARHLALRLAQSLRSDEPKSVDLEQHLPGWGRGVLLPAVVPLARLAGTIPTEAREVTAELVWQHLRTDTLHCYSCGEWLAAELSQQGGLVIFDGLDEVPSEKRKIVQQAICRFADQNEKCLCVVTCRTYSYVRDPRWQLGDDWPVHDLAPFDARKIESFIAAWYATLGEIDSAKRADYGRKEAGLRSALAPTDARRLHELAGVPLLLTVMAAVHTHERELPASRALIYDKCVNLLLERWATERTPDAEPVPLLEKLNLPDRGRLDKALQETAYRAHESGDWRTRAPDGTQPALVTEDLLRQVIEKWLDAERAGIFIEYCQTSNGLLMASGRVRLPDTPPDSPMTTIYTFPHLSFEEFLAARHLQSLPEMPSRVAELASEVRWQEVILFLAEYLCGTNLDWQAVEILRRLCPPDPQRKPDWRAVWLAGEALPALRGITIATTHDVELDSRVVARVASLVSEGHLTPVERAAAGRTLARLGDLRPGVTTLEGMEFCYVPAGPFWMGGDAIGARPLRLNEHLDYEYWMSRYPVTNGQFAEFVKAGGYAESSFWPEARHDRLWKNGKLTCRTWFPDSREDREVTAEAPQDYGEPFNLPNHPCVGVTWYEAMAFTRWLSEAWKDRLPQGWSARLPSEAEWEKGARGGVKIPAQAVRNKLPLLNRRTRLVENRKLKRIYPWGDKASPYFANYSATGIGSTSAVGCFPKGASPYGCEDLSGNVWEWTGSLWGEHYPDEPQGRRQNASAGKDVPRVLRGGAFYGSVGDVRSAIGLRLYPVGRLDFIGIRVVVSRF